MIHITGDTHGEQNRILDIEKRTNAKEGDIIIVCGDFGYVFLNNLTENRFLDDLEYRPFVYCFVDGNHENFPEIYKYPVENWNGGKIHRVRKNVIHLMRGQVFEIESKRFFTMGGAYSIDKYMRTEGYSWWKEELPTDEEYSEAWENLDKYDRKVDYIITHTAPKTIIRMMMYTPDQHDIALTSFLDEVWRDVDFKRWYFGHWHDEKTIAGRARLLWFGTETIE